MRGGIAAGLMALGSAFLTTAAQAEPELPALSTQGIAQAVVLCLAVDTTVERLRLQRRLCEQVRDLAAQGSPVPVATIGFGDPVLTRADVLGVLVHVTVDRTGPQPLAILSIRPHRAAGAAALFGAAPVIVPLGRDGTVRSRRWSPCWTRSCGGACARGIRNTIHSKKGKLQCQSVPRPLPIPIFRSAATS